MATREERDEMGLARAREHEAQALRRDRDRDVARDIDEIRQKVEGFDRKLDALLARDFVTPDDAARLEALLRENERLVKRLERLAAQN